MCSTCGPKRGVRNKRCGDVIIVRFADDIVVGFEAQADADGSWAELKERMRKFSLELHSEKTRLLEFGPFAAEKRKKRGEEAGDVQLSRLYALLREEEEMVVHGLSAYDAPTVAGEVERGEAELQRRMHDPIPDVGGWLRSVVGGHFRYYGVSGNIQALKGFRYEVLRTWQWALKRRSQKAKATWERMTRLEKRWLPRARIYHPYPSLTTAVTTQGKSPVP